MKKILVCYDETEVSDKVVAVALDYAKLSNAFVYLVTSKTGPDVSQSEIVETERQLDTYAKKMFRNNGVECEPHLLIRGLNPGEDIVEYAKDKDVEQIIIGIKKRSKVEKLVFGSTAQYVILEAHCPVLTIK